MPTYAQTNKPDLQLRDRLITRFKALTDALDKNDAAAVAANFTEDAILVTSYGPSWGRQAIEHWYAELFKEVQSSNNLVTVDEDSPHTLCTAGNELWATGKWSQTLKGQNGSTEVKGYWSAIAILEGDDLTAISNAAMDSAAGSCDGKWQRSWVWARSNIALAK